MRMTMLIISVLVTGLSLAAGKSPYVGEELRLIKSLSAEEIKSLKAGDGMGFAKLAELNHFPGPRHVLDLAEQLELNPAQLAATEALFDEMRSNAVNVGEELLLAEASLNREFAQSSISPGLLEASVMNIGRLRGQLRYVHLEAHLHQKKLLTEEQIEKYENLRGYRDTIHHSGTHTSADR